MTLRRASAVAACLLPVVGATAAAQFQQPPQQQQPPPCVTNFFKLRDDATQKAEAIKAASNRHASPAEACKLFNVFSAAEEKMIKYAVDNTTWCGIPPQVVEGLKKSHARTIEIRAKVCRAAAAPPRPAGPSLSDAFSAPITDSSNIRTGRGTFDTLTGNPLGK